MKKCSKCNQEKELECFASDLRIKSGKQASCKKCNSERGRKWAERNSEKVKLFQKEYAAKNAQKIRKYHKEWRRNNPEDKVNLVCENCQNAYFINKTPFRASEKKGRKHFCSIKCKNISEGKSILCKCEVCKKEILKQKSKFEKNENKMFFCGRSCQGFYSATHKNYGIKRSKLEIYINEQLNSEFPNLVVRYNEHDAINSELDIYIPSLNLAIELNGIFHYEPIFGEDKLTKIQNNDQRKFQACLEKGIELCIIDASSLRHTNPRTCKKYLDIILNLIRIKLNV